MNARIPSGLRDILPIEAAERRQIEQVLRNIFISWGYGEVITPAFEFYDTLSSQSGELIQREMFKLFDKSGEVLALRPELTTSVARLVAQRFKNKIAPFRFFYVQNVFREEPPQSGQQREFNQAGVELIGLKGSQADAEVISILVESLRSMDLDGFKVVLGNVGFLKSCMKEIGVSAQKQKNIIESLSRNDIVDYQRTLKAVSKDSVRVLEQLPYLRGKDAIKKARDLPQGNLTVKQLDGLEQTLEILKDQNLGRYIDIDLSLARYFEYYTGLVFEGYAPGLGFPFCGGGRYDNLLGKFGFSMPAVGFQIGMERLQILLIKANKIMVNRQKKYLVGYESDIKAAFKVASELRKKGNIATLAEFGNADEGISKSAKLGYEYFVQADGKECPVSVEISTQKKEKAGA